MRYDLATETHASRVPPIFAGTRQGTANAAGSSAGAAELAVQQVA